MTACSGSPQLSIIALAPNAWRGQWVNRQYLLSRLGGLHDVLYSTGAWTIWERGTPEWKQAGICGRSTRVDHVSVEEAPQVLMRWPRHAVYDRLIFAAHARRLRGLARWPTRAHKVALLFHPAFFPYIEKLEPDVVVYHAYDLFSGTPGWSARLQEGEDRLLARADLISAVSDAIAGELSARSGRAVRVLPNGVDIDLFEGAAASPSIPEDLAKIPCPRLAYVGSLHPQVDFGLVAALAEARPTYHFVLIGGRPEHRNPLAEEELVRCRSLPNVHFLGERPRDVVPHYLLHMDANLLVYRLATSSWVRAVYPLKLHEYLAAGKPIVSVNIASVRPFAHVLRIAQGLSDWLAALDDAVERGGAATPSERRAVALENGWDARAATLAAWLDAAVAQRNAQAGGN